MTVIISMQTTMEVKQRKIWDIENVSQRQKDNERTYSLQQIDTIVLIYRLQSLKPDST